MDQITAKLAEIDALVAALARAYRGLAAAAEADGNDYERIQKQAVADAERFERGATASMRSALAEIRRPKGPMATLRWTGSEPVEPLLVEVIRRTEKRVLLGRRYSSGTWHRISDGREVERRGDRWFGEWVITDESLEQIRAMSVGENAVSRALKGAKR